MLSFIAASFSFARLMNVSIESASTPVPLFRPAFSMVLQMLPGKWSI